MDSSKYPVGNVKKPKLLTAVIKTVSISSYREVMGVSVGKWHGGK